MGRRLFNGNAFSEDGWPYVDEGSCTWIVVPGTDPAVHLQIQNGPPLIIMGAFAADINAYVEHVRDPDSACWTPGNSVATSNHPGGTAMDIDWELHPFHVKNTFSPGQQATIRELLDWYEGMIFWGGDWDDPIDEMHWQMGGDTYDKVRDHPFPKVQDFINRKIRADGFSMFRRAAQPLSRLDQYALAVIVEGHKRNISPRGIQITLTVPFVESGWKMYANSNVPASLTYPHDAVGSDHDSTGLFQQRQAWGPLSCTMDPSCSAGLFYDGGQAGQRGLTAFDYNDPGRSPGSIAQAVQVSAFPDRYQEHWDEAVNLYNRLAGQPPPPPPPPPVGEDDFLSELSASEQRALFNAIMNQRESRSPLRHLGEGTIGDTPSLTWNIDGSVHVLVMQMLAMLRNPDTLTLLEEIATADSTKYPERQKDKELAQAILSTVPPRGGGSPVVRPTVMQPAPMVPEVLPAIRQPVQNTNTPEALLDTLDRLDRFDAEYRKRFAKLADVDSKEKK